MTLPSGISERRFSSAIQDLQEVVGNEWVFSSEEDVELYRDAYSIRWGHEDEYFASAAVAPANVEEVQGIVRIANEYQIPIYSISTGKNLTYGGPAPTYSGSIVLDLKRMNRVLEVDADRNFAVVEPGCSYFDLYRHIQERGLKVWIDCPDPGWGSPIGNALDHGVGYTASPFRDHWGSHCGMEVVLANGEVMRTGLGALPNSEAWHEHKSGIGPSVDGLFAQSNFGIVTKMGFWLMPEPEAWLTGTVSISKYSDLEALVNQCNYLEDAQIAIGQAIYRSPVSRTAATEIQELVADGWPTIAELDVFTERRAEAAWTVKLQYYGPEEVIQANWEYSQERISAAIPDATYSDVEMLSMPLTPEQEKTQHQVNFGIPNMSIFSLMARNSSNAGDPPDGHTDMFVVINRTAESVYRALKVVYDTQVEMRVPISVTPFRTPVTWHHRSFFISAPALPSERDDPDFNMEQRRLGEAYITNLSAAGFSPYRTHASFQDLVSELYSFNDNALLRFQERLKDAIDPNGILSPGRYGIWPERLRRNRA
ncbi:MAG: p-cresol methylhydroxylase [SAR86 cluster bacterium]|uniref:p-cresol methylhydroxylase n=1 Tax=SAR86 cluster bacterium TaxID=2030880 RepID=A0A2A5C6B5_9GAMM|nr:MAG: p-cresol methylhydroxylase [SAR86 cluster bacterium]